MRSAGCWISLRRGSKITLRVRGSMSMSPTTKHINHGT